MLCKKINEYNDINSLYEKYSIIHTYYIYIIFPLDLPFNIFFSAAFLPFLSSKMSTSTS